MKDQPIKPVDYKIHSQEIRSLLDILEPFFSNDDSEIQLFVQIKELLSDLDFDHTHTEQAYLSFLTLLFQAVISQIPGNTHIHQQLQLLQQKLEPPLDLQSVDILYESIQSVANKLRQMGVLSIEQASLILSPIIMEYEAAKKQAQRRTTTQSTQSAQAGAEKTTRNLKQPQKPDTQKQDSSRQSVGSSTKRITSDLRGSENYSSWPRSTASKPMVADVEESVPPHSLEQRRVLGADRRAPSNKIDTLFSGEEQKNYNKLIQSLQKDFVKQTRNAISQIASFSDQIEQEIDIIKSMETIEDIQSYRHKVISTLEKLQLRHNELATNFETARTYLSVIESGNQHLMDELDRVRLLSLTDELTGLPNRRAFLRRLQYEVSRVKRYQYPITLVLVDLDHFKSINDRYGHEGGDEVLKVYTNTLFSLFRQHDSVARYGGEEFVMLFPNTNLGGVLKALDKVQEKCKTITVKIANMEFQLPSFSAGVVEYQRGESSGHFIARADKELYRAKRGGRSRVSFDRSRTSYHRAEPDLAAEIESDLGAEMDIETDIDDIETDVDNETESESLSRFDPDLF